MVGKTKQLAEVWCHPVHLRNLNAGKTGCVSYQGTQYVNEVKYYQNVDIFVSQSQRGEGGGRESQVGVNVTTHIILSRVYHTLEQEKYQVTRSIMGAITAHSRSSEPFYR